MEEEEEENVKFLQILTRFYFFVCRHPVHRSIQTCSALISDISSFPTFLEFYPGPAAEPGHSGHLSHQGSTVSSNNKTLDTGLL